MSITKIDPVTGAITYAVSSNLASTAVINLDITSELNTESVAVVVEINPRICLFVTALDDMRDFVPEYSV